MQRVLALAILLMMVIAVAPTTAQTFDNDGGGTWIEYMSFPITSIPSDYAIYKIIINGTSWELYNVTGGLEATGINDNFWNIVNSTGADIRVFDQNGNQLYFWIESFDAVNKKAVIWVNLSARTTELNVAYGNPQATPSTYNNRSQIFIIYDTNLYNITNAEYLLSYYLTQPYVFEAEFNIITGYAGFVFNALDADNLYMHQIAGSATAQTPNYFRFHTKIAGTYYLEATADTGLIINENSWYKVRFVVNNYTFTAQIISPTKGLIQSWTDTNQRYSAGYIGFRESVTERALFKNITVIKYADTADFGTPTIKQFLKQLAQRTLYVDVTYLDTQTTVSHNPPTYFLFEPKDSLNVSASLSITGVNATVGANIVIKLIDKVTLTTVIYNGTDITASLTYQGTETNATTGEVYNLYNFTTYENGTLEVYGTIPNIAVNTVFKFDGDVVDVAVVQAVIGEDFDIELPWTGNITVASKQFTNVSNATINTKDLGTGAFNVLIVIEDIDNYKLGYLTKTLNVTYGSLSVTVRHKDLSPFTNAIVSSYNEKFGIITTDLNKLYAGNNVISVSFHGVKLKSVTFYLNHTTTGASITIDVNSTRFKDYRGVNRTIASPNSFEVVNLSAYYPYSVMEIRNYSGTVIIDYEANPPTAVDVEGADFVEYIAPVLKFSGSGNATITDLYKLTVTIKDRLGNPVNFYVTVNGSRVDASKGIAAKLLKPSWYEVVAPTEVNGFKLWKFNDSSNVALVEVNTSDVTLPTAEYRVPTAIETKEVRIESLFGWLPIPFLSPKEEENVTIVRLEGSLKDFYGAPVANKTIKIEVASPKFTRIYNVTTDSSGNFKLDVDMAKGIEYKVTYTFEGDDVYVETSTSKTFLVEQLLPAPPAPTEPLLIVVIVAAIGAGVVAIVYMAKKRTAVARTRIEDEFRFFRRLK